MNLPYPMSDEHLADRGVYRQPFLVRGMWEWVAVDSRGEQVASGLIAKGRDPSSLISRLWRDLNEADPILPHQEQPSFLRLIPVIAGLVLEGVLTIPRYV